MAAPIGGSQVLVSADKRFVSLEAIEGELRRIWQEAAEAYASTAGPSAMPQARVRLANMLICKDAADSSLNATELDALLSDLTVIYPSRFFIIEFNSARSSAETKDNGLTARVSSRCVQARSGAHVCSEEIWLQLESVELASLRQLIFSLLLRDLPVVMLYAGAVEKIITEAREERAIAPLILLLREIADKVIYDSVLFSNFARSLAALDKAKLLKGNNELVDLSWARLSRLRLAIAEQFENTEAQALLAELEAINISVQVSRRNFKENVFPGEVFLLAAWLLFCLKIKEEQMPMMATRCGDGLREIRLYNANQGRELVLRFSLIEPSGCLGAKCLNEECSIDVFEHCPRCGNEIFGAKRLEFFFSGGQRLELERLTPVMCCKFVVFDLSKVF